MTDQYDPSRHEAGDRVFVIGQQFSDFIADHRFIAARPDLKQLAEKIADDLAELYQAVWRDAP